MILFPTVWDALLGEWKGLAARQIAYGVVVLMESIVVLALAQYFYQINPLG